MPAVKATLRIVSQHATFFGLIGGSYALVSSGAEFARGRRDVWNGVLGGFAAGAVVAMRGKPLVGLGAGAAFAAVSAFYDLTQPGQQEHRQIVRKMLAHDQAQSN
jgi:hypothetical protein